MNRQALSKLEEILSAPSLPVDQFCLGVWYQPDPYWYSKKCGAAACAAGCAALHPWFQERGFCLEIDTLMDPPRWYRVEYQGRIGTKACAKFFETGIEATQWIFHPSYYHKYRRSGGTTEIPTLKITAKMVAERIRYLLSLDEAAVKAIEKKASTDHLLTCGVEWHPEPEPAPEPAATAQLEEAMA